MTQQYLTKQHSRFTAALAKGNQLIALDALWRAASYLNLLPEGQQEISSSEAHHYRSQLGW